MLIKEKYVDIIKNDGKNIGTRVKVFDHLLYKDDISTPLSITMKIGTIIKRYTGISCLGYFYEDLVDIRFDYIRFEHLQGEERHISRGHFTEGIEII